MASKGWQQELGVEYWSSWKTAVATLISINFSPKTSNSWPNMYNLMFSRQLGVSLIFSFHFTKRDRISSKTKPLEGSDAAPRARARCVSRCLRSCLGRGGADRIHLTCIFA